MDNCDRSELEEEDCNEKLDNNSDCNEDSFESNNVFFSVVNQEEDEVLSDNNSETVKNDINPQRTSKVWNLVKLFEENLISINDEIEDPGDTKDDISKDGQVSEENLINCSESDDKEYLDANDETDGENNAMDEGCEISGDECSSLNLAEKVVFLSPENNCDDSKSANNSDMEQYHETETNEDHNEDRESESSSKESEISDHEVEYRDHNEITSLPINQSDDEQDTSEKEQRNNNETENIYEYVIGRANTVFTESSDLMSISNENSQSKSDSETESYNEDKSVYKNEYVNQPSLSEEINQNDNESIYDELNDSFNKKFRYGLRNSKSIKSMSKEEYFDRGKSIYQISRTSENGVDLNIPNNLVDHVYENTTENRISGLDEDVFEENIYETINENISSNKFESLYNFQFVDPLEDLNSLFRNKIDGILNAPPEINYEKLPKLDEKEDNDIIENNNIKIEDFNTKALDADAKTYQLERFDQNVLIIFNQININGYRPRYGSNRDVEALKTVFNEHKFEVVEHVDLTRDMIFGELEQFSQKNFTDYGCVAIAILTHGSDMGVLRAKDRIYYETDVIKLFRTSKNPTLISKPKVFIIQACRGSEISESVLVNTPSKSRFEHDGGNGPKTYSLPVESDILVIHSTFPGKVSYRDEINGTWFIQTLCNKINELSFKEDLESIVTEVKREIAIDKSQEEYNRGTSEMDLNKQMPVLISTLIRKLYLKKVGDVEDHVNPINEINNCQCEEQKFIYLRECLKHYLEDKEDPVGSTLLDLSDGLVGKDFDPVKERLTSALKQHLSLHARDEEYYKYLFL